MGTHQDTYPVNGYEVVKDYDPFAQQCLDSLVEDTRWNQGQWAGDGLTTLANGQLATNDVANVYTTDTYNFMGNPLQEEVKQYQSQSFGGPQIGGAVDNTKYSPIGTGRSIGSRRQWWTESAIAAPSAGSRLPTTIRARPQRAAGGQTYETFSSAFASFSVDDQVEHFSKIINSRRR